MFICSDSAMLVPNLRREFGGKPTQINDVD